MAKTRYGHLVKKLPVQKGTGGANAEELIWMVGKNLEGLDLHFALGRYQGTGIWHPWAGPHVHPADECLLCFGHDTDDPGYFGAELELALGEEQEKHVFSTPSAVVLPAGLPHCPLVTRKVDKPFAHGHVVLAPDMEVDWWPPESKPIPTDGSKYSHLIKPLTVQNVSASAGTRELNWMTGDQLEGFNLNLAVGLCAETGQLYPGRGAHSHPNDECLVFFGHDPHDLGYLGAEIEIALGEEKEKHTFNVPTAVIVPKGLPHFPLVVKNVDKPFGFIVYNLGPRHDTTWLD
jgi:hypothetical protein